MHYAYFPFAEENLLLCTATRLSNYSFTTSSSRLLNKHLCYSPVTSHIRGLLKSKFCHASRVTPIKIPNAIVTRLVAELAKPTCIDSHIFRNCIHLLPVSVKNAVDIYNSFEPCFIFHYCRYIPSTKFQPSSPLGSFLCSSGYFRAILRKHTHTHIHIYNISNFIMEREHVGLELTRTRGNESKL